MPDTDEVRALLRNSHLLYVGDPAPPAESGGDWGPAAAGLMSVGLRSVERKQELPDRPCAG